MSLNNRINAKMFRVKNYTKPLTDNQKTQIISLFISGENNTIPEIMKKTGFSFGRIDGVISEYLRKPNEPNFLIFESKMNQL